MATLLYTLPMTSLPSSPLLEAVELTRYHGDTCVVDKITISVERGEVLGLLGLNGAGKSSTLKMLAGISSPSSGTISICGHSLLTEPLDAKRNLGYLPETPPLYMDMRVNEYLRFAGKIRGLKGTGLKSAITRVLEDCDLELVEKRIIGNLSKGFRQRVGLAQALIHSPPLIILDEPSSGLDPQQMIDMRALIDRLSAHHGIVFSTHLLAEATQVCSHVCVIHAGQLVGQQSLLEPATSETKKCRLTVRENLLETDLLSLSGVIAAVLVENRSWHLTVQASTEDRLLNQILQRGWHVQEFGAQQPELESLFSALVNEDPLVSSVPLKTKTSAGTTPQQVRTADYTRLTTTDRESNTTRQQEQV